MSSNLGRFACCSSAFRAHIGDLRSRIFGWFRFRPDPPGPPYPQHKFPDELLGGCWLLGTAQHGTPTLNDNGTMFTNPESIGFLENRPQYQLLIITTTYHLCVIKGLRSTLQGTNISQLGKRKIIFKGDFGRGCVSSEEGNFYTMEKHKTAKWFSPAG